MVFSSSQRYVAEFVGTFSLLLFGGGAAVFTLDLGSREPVARLVGVALAFGFVIVALAFAFGEISGGHFNPAVTVSMALSRRMPLRDVVPYLVAQVLGAIVGIVTVAGIAAGSSVSFNLAQTSALASQCYADSGAPAGCGSSLAAAFLVELALTFGFVLVIQLASRPESGAGRLAPVAIGLALFVTNVAAIPVDGASINPARSFAPALVSAVWPAARWAIAESWLFWVAPIAGGVLASFVERALRPGTEAPTPAPAQGS